MYVGMAIKTILIQGSALMVGHPVSLKYILDCQIYCKLMHNCNEEFDAVYSEKSLC